MGITVLQTELSTSTDQKKKKSSKPALCGQRSTKPSRDLIPDYTAGLQSLRLTNQARTRGANEDQTGNFTHCPIYI